MQGPLDHWLGYRDCLPLVLSPLPELCAAQLERWHDQNLRMLQAIAVLDEHHAAVEGGGALEAEIARLHQKLDVALELLGAVLRAGRRDAPPVAVRLSREGLSWPATLPTPPAPRLLVELGLHPLAPSPLCWPVVPIGTHENEVCARFEDMSESLGAALERHVFTRHRRSVAGARSPAGALSASGASRQSVRHSST
ncbi:PilZ domain-containing protein [Sinimarinibacterium thermocellulolyticum]|uniref:PilZ domain-containing protein n=1 Tax=Sinimarinibacterium thermocellulolyticum TaxID=3170016 RepID=A0ABV2AA93_9GAMM